MAPDSNSEVNPASGGVQRHPRKRVEDGAPARFGGIPTIEPVVPAPAGRQPNVESGVTRDSE